MYSTHSGLYLGDPSHCSAHGSIRILLSPPDAKSGAIPLCLSTYVPSLSAGGIARPIDHSTTISLSCANIKDGKYIYLKDLQQLATVSTSIPLSQWPTYVTPINLPALEPFLTTHPDQAYANFIRQGLSQGFRIGYSTVTNKLISRRKNHPSSQEQAAAVDERILSELTAGRLFGPLPPPQNVLVHVKAPLAWSPNHINQTNGA